MSVTIDNSSLRSTKVLWSFLLASFLVGASSSTWAATSIGASFIGRGATDNLLPSESAGLTPQTNWNNIDSGTTFKGTSDSLLDGDGNFLSVKIIYDCSDSWNSDGGTSTPNEKLMKGIIKANPDPDLTPANNTDRMLFVVTNLPTGSYNVTVYLEENGANQSTTGAQVDVSLGATTYYVEQEGTFTGTFIAATSTTAGNYVLANYAEFDGVAPAGDGTITITARKHIFDPQLNDGAGVAGIQIVQTSGGAFSLNTTPCSITANPQSTLTVEGSSASFSVASQGPCKLQWQKNGVDLPGKIDPILNLTAALADDGAQIRCIVYNNVNTNTSTAATLSVDAATSPVLTQGFLKTEQWQNIGDNGGIDGIGDLKTNIPGTGVVGNPPTVTFYVAGANVPQTSPDLSNFGDRAWGWVKPDVTGDYDFFIRSDDASELYLNSVNPGAGTNTLPDVQVDLPICEEYTCCHPFQEPPATTATVSPIHLEAGKLYGMVILLKEVGGGDFVQVAWRLTTDTTPAANLKPILPGNVWTIASGAGHRATLGDQPKTTSVVEGRPVSFSVSATTTPAGDPLGYAWLANGVPIPGEQGTKYVIKSAALTDNGKIISAQVFTLAGVLATTNATLNVIPDTFPPVPSASAIRRSDGAIQVGVGFDEAVNLSDLVSANFSLIGGTSSTVSFPTNSYGDYKGVLFDTTGLAVGNTYTVHVANVRDVKGNAIPAAGTNVTFTVGDSMAWADTGTPIRPGQVIPVGSGGFDVLNGSRQEWGTYDELTIAYMAKTNDFDVKVQLIYAEPGSEWTRVGLHARNDLNVGEPVDDRNNATGDASAYAQTHVNPNQTLGSSGRFDPNDPIQPVNPTPNNSHEQNVRLAKGSTSSGWQSVNAGAPSFPDVWLRLARVGTNLIGYASTDGVAWSQQGTTSLVDQQPFMYVGMSLAVETGNIWGGGFDVWGAPFDATYDRLFVAQFRNFGNTFPPSVSIATSGANISVTFTGTLLSSPSLSGPWTPVATTSPYVTSATGSASFFRASD